MAQVRQHAQEEALLQALNRSCHSACLLSPGRRQQWLTTPNTGQTQPSPAPQT